MQKKIIYEHPLNERTRIFLRLEYLFNQAAHHVKCSTSWDSRATLHCILEILSIFGNTQLKSEVIKELERHSSSLRLLGENPAVDAQQLAVLLDNLDEQVNRLHRINGQIASSLKSSEFLTSIQQRSAIPGGTCDFDLPAYHYWLQMPARERSQDLYRWLDNFDSIGQAIQLILKLTRESTLLKPEVAAGGIYQQTLDPETPCQLVRVALPPDAPWFSEISGGRHRFTARFMQFSTVEHRAKQTDQDVRFELACCIL